MTGTQSQSGSASGANGQAAPHELFALTDEQILEIEPEQEARGAAVEQPLLAVPARRADTANAQSAAEPTGSTALSPLIENTQQSAQAGVPVLLEPPAWLAAQMTDPWTGADAKEFWNGVQQSKQEAAAYRAAFATPEEARALKELYPGGVSDARAAANRARLLEQIDQAYFGPAGGTAEQTGAERTQLAELMLREDPVAFREMVFAGLRALEEAEKGTGASSSVSNLPRLAQIFSSGRADVNVAPPFSAASTPSSGGATLGSPAGNLADVSTSGASPAPTPPYAVAAGFSSQHDASLVGARHAVPASGTTPADSAHVAAYAAFEKAANEDLERTVGAAITRTLEQALPNLERSNRGAMEGARHGVPLSDRLSAAIRQDVEAALKGDRQLGEQIAQILAARRFDNETRAQVVRLIDDRARQLVPSAAKRVIGDWTHATLAAHRGSVARSDSASSRTEVEPAATHATGAQGLPAGQAGAGPAALSSRAAQTRPGGDQHRNASRSDARRVDYRKLSDEQILEL